MWFAFPKDNPKHWYSNMDEYPYGALKRPTRYRGTSYSTRGQVAAKHLWNAAKFGGPAAAAYAAKKFSDYFYPKVKMNKNAKRIYGGSRELVPYKRAKKRSPVYEGQAINLAKNHKPISNNQDRKPNMYRRRRFNRKRNRRYRRRAGRPKRRRRRMFRRRRRRFGKSLGPYYARGAGVYQKAVDYTDTIDVDKNSRVFHMTTFLGDSDQFEDLTTSAGQSGVPFTGSAADNANYLISKAVQNMAIRNHSTNKCYITAYLITPRLDIPNAVTNKVSPIQILEDGWKAQLDVGDDALVNRSSSTLTVDNFSATIFQNNFFVRSFKILKVKKCILNAGELKHLKISFRNRIMNNLVHAKSGTHPLPHGLFRKRSYGWLFEIKGAIVEDDTHQVFPGSGRLGIVFSNRWETRFVAQQTNETDFVGNGITPGTGENFAGEDMVIDQYVEA